MCPPGQAIHKCVTLFPISVYQYWLLDGMLRAAVLLIVTAAVSVQVLYERMRHRLNNAFSIEVALCHGGKCPNIQLFIF